MSNPEPFNTFGSSWEVSIDTHYGHGEIPVTRGDYSHYFHYRPDRAPQPLYWDDLLYSMEKIKTDIRYIKEKTKGEDWQLKGKAMTEYFGKNCYWLFWRYPESKIMRAWHIAQKEDDHDMTHLLQNIKTS